ncbi:conserved hypothetical protein [Luminiphilus syltensis NOR5-1B]|uniref:Uncharacterized protein n=1 Tax=Luminiphilus syltensis NOR5-1B TaxID=565045 RepID=B8KVY3_9GAMM|nr:hypothetical protein [Luminiphilus syltensis]EED34308.1 conserved hypothetical protein [Luminiphilus syltensis NOR5-1B]
MTDISYSFSVTEPGTSAPVERFAFTDCELVRINSDMCLVINRLNGKQGIIAPHVVEALTYCSRFKTIDEHAVDLARTRPELKGNSEAAKAALTTLDKSGLLMRASEIAARLKPVEKQEVAPTRVFIITCDRPAAVERLLESMLEVGTLASHEGFYLIDDSRNPENQAKNAALVESFSIRAAKTMQYIGPQQQQALLQGLIGALPEHEAGIRFLIDAEQWPRYASYGRSRTLALLYSVGYRAIVLDDDILCQGLKPVIEETGVAFGAGTRQAAYFPSDEIMMQLRQPTDFDALSGHASLLGQPLGYAINQLNQGPLNPDVLADTNAMLVSVLKPEGKVLITQCGSWGDPGTANSHSVLGIDPDSLDRLLAAPKGIAETLADRRMWLGNTRPGVLKLATMSQMTGIDNSVLLPPYFPVFRGEDLLFGAMVETMHHDGAAVEYDWCVPHLPLEKRKTSLRDPIAAKGGIGSYAGYLIDQLDYHDSANPEIRLRTIAWDLRRIAGRSDDDLIVDYKKSVAEALGQQLGQIASQQKRSTDVSSQNWHQYLDRAKGEVEAALAREHYPSELDELPEGTTNAEVINEFRDMADGFAAGLEAWPAMRDVAANLNHH